MIELTKAYGTLADHNSPIADKLEKLIIAELDDLLEVWHDR